MHAGRIQSNKQRNVVIVSNLKTKLAVGSIIVVGSMALSGGFAYSAGNPMVSSSEVKTKKVKKRPCYLHASQSKPNKKQCLKAYKRSRQAWPKNPTEAEIKKRVGAYHWAKAARVANCETGGTRGATANRGNLNWYPNGTYQGPLGMYRQTAAYGKRVTQYYSPKNWQEWVAVAVASHPITRGWSGWGCRGA